MHMRPVFCVRTLVGSSVAAVSGDSPACDLALFAHPFVEGAASGHLQRSFIDDRQRCFAPEAVVPTATRLSDRNLNAVEIGWPFRLGLEGCIVDRSQDIGWQSIR